MFAGGCSLMRNSATVKNGFTQKLKSFELNGKSLKTRGIAVADGAISVVEF